MLTRTNFSVFTFFTFFSASLLLSASISRADSPTVSQDDRGAGVIGVTIESIQDRVSNITPESAVIQGQVHFDYRYTRVMAEQCGRGPCQRSTKYWVMVIKSNNVDYEYRTELNAGMDNPPDLIDIGGVLLRPGSSVKIEGQVVSGGPNRYLLLDIKDLALVMD